MSDLVQQRRERIELASDDSNGSTWKSTSPRQIGRFEVKAPPCVTARGFVSEVWAYTCPHVLFHQYCEWLRLFLSESIVYRLSSSPN